MAGESTEVHISDDEDDSIHSISALDMIKNRNFELPSNDHNLLPDWLDDNDLKNSTMETLPAQEEQFWMDLIDKYLEPIEPTEEEKVKLLEK